MIQILEFIFTYRHEIFIIVLAGFLGIEVISHVPSVLHTPLMSGANAIQWRDHCRWYYSSGSCGHIKNIC